MDYAEKRAVPQAAQICIQEFRAALLCKFHGIKAGMLIRISYLTFLRPAMLIRNVNRPANRLATENED